MKLRIKLHHVGFGLSLAGLFDLTITNLISYLLNQYETQACEKNITVEKIQ
jgi:hypothetical protein